MDVAAQWATMLSPVAAVVTLVFAGLAVMRAPAESMAEAPPRVEDLVGSAPGEAIPAVFTRDTLEDLDLDVVLTAIATAE
jgi:hypothetical protein